MVGVHGRPAHPRRGVARQGALVDGVAVERRDGGQPAVQCRRGVPIDLAGPGEDVHVGPTDGQQVQSGGLEVAQEDPGVAAIGSPGVRGAIGGQPRPQQLVVPFGVRGAGRDSWDEVHRVTVAPITGIMRVG